MSSDNYIKEFYEFWRKVGCPKCETINWIYDSHSQRAYPYVPNGCECHSCKNRFFIGDREEFNLRYGDKVTEYGLTKVVEEYLDCQEGRIIP